MLPNEPTQDQQNPTQAQPQQPPLLSSPTPSPAPILPAPKKRSFAKIILTVCVVTIVLSILVGMALSKIGTTFVKAPIAISDEEISAQAQKDLQPLLQNDLPVFYRTALSIQDPKIEGLDAVISKLQTSSQCNFTPQTINRTQGGFDAGANKIDINGTVRCADQRDTSYTINLSYKGDSGSPEKYSINTANNIAIESSSRPLLDYLYARQLPTNTHATITSLNGRTTYPTYNSYKEFKTDLNTGKLGTSCTETVGTAKVTIELGAKAGVGHNDSQPYAHFTNGVISYDKSSKPDDYLVIISTEATCQ